MSNDMRVCVTCGVSQPFSNFGQFTQTKSGKTYQRGQCKTCRREYAKSYYQRFAKRYQEYDRRRYRENAKRRSDMSRRAGEWNKANRPWHLFPDTTRAQRMAIYERDGGRCHICGRKVSPDKFHLDHLVPIAAGGPDEFLNLRVAHPFCNLSRGPGRKPAQLILL